MKLLPSPNTIYTLLAVSAAALAALLLRVPATDVGWTVLAVLAAGAVWTAIDFWLTRRAWRAAPLQWTRTLPDAFALGVQRTIDGTLVNTGSHRWRVAFFDHADPDLDPQGLPVTADLRANAEAKLRYTVQPRRRGRVAFEPADVRVQSLGRSLELQWRIGAAQTRPVFPNFASVSRYAWLATDRRLAAIGIKTQVQRGEGTDFKQLAEYRPGDSIRHIDWKATLKQSRPIVRQFQDERDQCVIFLIDCGRRMRADEGTAERRAVPSSALPLGGRAGHGPDLGAHVPGSHFDEALNATMLLAHVALKDGDEVGALTFGTSPEHKRAFAPRKGMATLSALTVLLHDIQPEATHSDYLIAARDLMRVHSKRALIVLLTNFRDEDAPELDAALKLLRSRHLVLLASLRERVLREITEQPLTAAHHAVEVAGAHLFAQARRDAFRRLAERDALMVDAEPERLAVELVNRYRTVKRAGLL
jgi:uncharacterized protein (DUF58 family)